MTGVQTCALPIYNMIRSYTGGVYAKNYGFNANRVEDQGYIEFRYPGHVLKKEDITNLTLYYAYIIKLSLDPSFKREEYNSRLVKLLQDLLFISGDKEESKFLNVFKRIRPIIDAYLNNMHPNNNYSLDLLRILYENIIDNEYPDTPTRDRPVPRNFDSILWFFRNSQKIKTISDLLNEMPDLKKDIINEFAKHQKNPVFFYYKKKLQTVENQDSKSLYCRFGPGTRCLGRRTQAHARRRCAEAHR